MSLTILYSDRVDTLAADLRARLLARLDAGADPFEFVPVAVPNRNLEKWLRIRAFESAPRLAAGLEFPFLDTFLADLLRENLPAGSRPDPLSEDRLRIAVARLLADPGNPALAPLRRYVDPSAPPDDPLDPASDESARKLWQLAARLAALVADYERRRPRMVEDWLSAAPPPAPLSEVELAERALVRGLFAPDGLFPPSPAAEALSLRQLFALVRAAPPKGPARPLYFFGHSSLTPLHAQILQWLSRTHEVVFYHLTVCLEYWGDVRTPWERARDAASGRVPPGEDLDCENELLAAWGRAGRETMRLLVDLEEENRGVDLRIDALHPAPPDRPPTVLSAIQSSVRTRASDLPRLPQDASVQVVSSQSVRREVETVHNAILGAVWQPSGSGTRPWPPCDFSDIAVLVPDMATYRPVIEEVFDGRAQIPYGLVDASAAQDSALLRGLLSFFRLAASGLDRAPLFEVLANPCVQRALHFTPDDLRDWRARTAEIGAFRAFDATDAASLGLTDSANTSWDYALSRLRLAAVAESVADPSDSFLLPLPGRAADSDLRFSEIVESLHLALSPLRSARLPCVAPFSPPDAPPASWLEAVSRLLARFLEPAPGDRLEAQVRSAVLAAVSSLEAFGPRRLPFVSQCIAQFVGALPARRGGYLTSGVTIASLQPMRPVPFRQVFVLGLNEGRFPGSAAESTLDLRGLGRAVGDALKPDLDRYLFLETLMAARDRLVLSYVSRDLRKDQQLFPSSLVRDLERFASDHVLPPSAPFREAATPLLESDPRSAAPVSWSPSDPLAGLLPTYHAKSRQAAILRASSDQAAPPSPLDGELSTRPPSSSPSTLELPLRHLAAFLTDPLRALLRHRFGIPRKTWQTRDLPEDPALSLDAPSTWAAHDALLHAWLDAPSPPSDADLASTAARVFDDLRRRGAMPLGFIGDHEFSRSLGNPQKIAAARAALDAAGLRGTAPRPPAPLRVRLPLDVDLPDTPPVHLLLTGEIPLWFPPALPETAATALLLRKGSGGLLPPKHVIAPLLVWIAACAAPDGGLSPRPTSLPPPLRILLLDLEANPSKNKPETWHWSPLPPADARAWLADLAAEWLRYGETADPAGRLPAVGWPELAAAWQTCCGNTASPLPAAADWTAIRSALKNPDPPTADRALAVEHLSAAFRLPVSDLSPDLLPTLAATRFRPLFAARPTLP